MALDYHGLKVTIKKTIREGIMHVVSVINYKGGVGKTTTTANLAAELAWRGKDVLIIDLDPQASLTFSFIKPGKMGSSLCLTHNGKREEQNVDSVLSPESFGA